MGQLGKVGVKTHAELPDVSTPHALADLVAAVCSETEADGKITIHGGLPNAHHAQSHTLASHSTKAHTELTGVSANQHHAEVHSHLTVVETQVFSGAAPTAWTDLNLSGTIGAQATLVLLKIVGTNGYDVAFRKNGDTDEFYDASTPANSGYGVASVYRDPNIHAALLVATDNNGIIEWKSGSAAGSQVIDVIAYIK